MLRSWLRSYARSLRLLLHLDELTDGTAPAVMQFIMLRDVAGFVREPEPPLPFHALLYSRPTDASSARLGQNKVDADLRVRDLQSRWTLF